MLLLGKTQEKHLGNLTPTVPDLPPPPREKFTASIMTTITWQTRCFQQLENETQAGDRDEQDVHRNHTMEYSRATSHPIRQTDHG